MTEQVKALEEKNELKSEVLQLTIKKHLYDVDQFKKRSSHKAIIKLLTTLGKKRFTRKEYIAVSVALGVKEKTASNRLDDNLKAKRPSIKRLERGKFRIITQAEYNKFLNNLK